MEIIKMMEELRHERDQIEAWGRLRDTARLVFMLALTPLILVFFAFVAIFMADADEA